jgi:Rad3-related DNA helicase
MKQSKEARKKVDQLDVILEVCGQIDNHDLNYLLRDYIREIRQNDRKKIVEEIEKELTPFNWENNTILWRTIDEKDWNKLKNKLSKL